MRQIETTEWNEFPILAPQVFDPDCFLVGCSAPTARAYSSHDVGKRGSGLWSAHLREMCVEAMPGNKLVIGGIEGTNGHLDGLLCAGMTSSEGFMETGPCDAPLPSDFRSKPVLGGRTGLAEGTDRKTARR